MKENKTKTSEAQKRATAKYLKENYYAKSNRFKTNDFPKEDFEKALKEINKLGYSYNRWLTEKLKELIKE